MTQAKKSLRSPLGKVRGLGSAHSGTGHWQAQRITALFLIPLIGLLLACFMCTVVHGDYTSTYTWLHKPWAGAFTLLFLAAGFYHGLLGLQVIIEDYLHNAHFKLAALILVKFFGGLFFILGVIAVLRIQLTDVIPHV